MILDKIKQEIKAELKAELEAEFCQSMLTTVSRFLEAVFESGEFMGLDTFTYVPGFGEAHVRTSRRVGKAIIEKARAEFQKDMDARVDKRVKDRLAFLTTEAFIDDVVSRILRKQI